MAMRSPRSRRPSPHDPSTWSDVEPRKYLRADTDGAPNRQLTTEELLLLWVANQNPAFMRYDDLFDDRDLAASTDYPRVVAAIRKQSAKEAERPDGQDLVERLLEPGRQVTRLPGRPAALDPRQLGGHRGLTTCSTG